MIGSVLTKVRYHHCSAGYRCAADETVGAVAGLLCSRPVFTSREVALAIRVIAVRYRLRGTIDRLS